MVSFDITYYKDHVYNQSGQSDKKNNDRKLWEILLDSKSTCNVIINKKLLTNIRRCNWTLKLQTQAGFFYVTQVGDMKRFRTV